MEIARGEEESISRIWLLFFFLQLKTENAIFTCSNLYYFSNHSDITPTALNDTANIKSRTLSDQWSFHHGLYSYGTFAEAVPVCLTYYSNGKRYKSGPKRHVCKASRDRRLNSNWIIFSLVLP